MSEVKGQGHTLIQVCSGVGIHFDTGTEVATICHYCQRALCKNAGREAKRKGTRESITGVHAHSASAAIYHSGIHHQQQKPVDSSALSCL